MFFSLLRRRLGGILSGHGRILEASWGRSGSHAKPRARKHLKNQGKPMFFGLLHRRLGGILEALGGDLEALGGS